jgi:peptide/nickel transport system substrate-binding protein
MIRVGGISALALAAALSLGATIGASAQERVIVAGGADITAMNALDQITIVPDRALMENIADPLLRWDEPGKLGPGLATKWTLVEPKTWELELRRGVKFQNGETFDANAVKFFYDTMNDPKLISPTKTNHTWVERVEIIDDYKVRLHTRRLYPVAANQMAVANMMPPEYVKRVGYDGYRAKPIGTGPYRYVEHVKDSQLTLAANDDYWGGKPKIRTIIYRPIKEDAARVSALVAGEIDLALDVPPELIPVVQTRKDLQVKQVLSTRTFIMNFSKMDPSYPTNKREVREAIDYAIDREALNKAILGGTGAAAAWLNPAMFGANNDIKPRPYDPKKARELLAQAGFPNGFDVDFDIPQGRYLKDKEMGEAIAGQLSAVGIRARPRVMEWGVFTKRQFSHQASPISLIAWVDSQADTDSQNRLLMLSGSTWSQGGDKELDALLEKIAVETDPEKRKAMIFEQQDYLRREVYPISYVAQMGLICAVSPKLAWFEPRSDEKYFFFQPEK